ncbi:hypothetical protein EV182_007623 [Spiromyces aspiralis]|uniref:Uncharacterized protein n=1 Tax=Spiromyces aspiralis TaxID=68401 RepID=A0ACC1HMU9_9FUNG|nr:hypothetical protein EV182_007623 [Spiromyces aspiralis]
MSVAWATSVAPDSKFKRMEELRDATFGVSRMMSGSHIMPQYGAKVHGWEADLISFKELGDINELVRGTKEGKVDAFMWERTTTKRYYDKGDLRMLGVVTPPWPAFSFVARQDVIEAKRSEFDDFFRCLNQVNEAFVDAAPEQRQRSINFIMNKFGYGQEDVEQWFAQVQYARDTRKVDLDLLERASSILRDVGAATVAKRGEEMSLSLL